MSSKRLILRFAKSARIPGFSSGCSARPNAQGGAEAGRGEGCEGGVPGRDFEGESGRARRRGVAREEAEGAVGRNVQEASVGGGGGGAALERGDAEQ